MSLKQAYDDAVLKVLQSDGKRIAELDAECYELRQQLSAALAAIKSKDAALQSAISAHKYESGDLHDALAIQPDDSALKAWIGEPVAWLHENRPEADVITDAVKNVWTGVVVGKDSVYSIPLYAPKGLK